MIRRITHPSRGSVAVVHTHNTAVLTSAPRFTIASPPGTLRPTGAVAFSVAAWVFGRGVTVFSSAQGVWPTGVSVRDNQFFIRGGTAGTIHLTANPSSNCWKYLVWTYDGSNTAAGVKCYVNGHLVTTTTVTDTSPAASAGTGPVNIGTTFNGSNYQGNNGLLADVAFFTYELTAADVRELYANSRDYGLAALSGEDPYGHWSLAGNGTDAGTGANDMTATNYSGSAYRDADTRALPIIAPPYPWPPASVGAVAEWSLDGSLDDDIGSLDLTATSGSPAYTTWPNGHRLLDCSSAQAFVRSSHDSALALTGDMTAMCLVYPRRVTTAATLIGMTGIIGDTGDTDNYLYWFVIDTNRSLFFLSEHGSGVNSSFSSAADAVPVGELSHVGFTRSSNVVRMYVNGALIATSGTLTTPTGGSNARFGVGGFGHSSESTVRLNGKIGAVQVVGSALSDAQMLAAAEKARLNL